MVDDEVVRHLDRPRARRRWAAAGPAPVVLLMASGLPLLSAAAAVSGRGGPASHALLVGALVVIVVPAVVAVLLSRPRPATHALLALTSAVVLEAGRIVLHTPAFVSTGDLAESAALARLVGSDGLLTGAVSPGLAVVTVGTHALLGVSLPASAALVLVLARAVSSLSVLLVVRRVTGSTRLAAAAVLVQAAAPPLLLSSDLLPAWALAVPLGLFLVHLLAGRERRGGAGLLPVVAVGLVLAWCDVVTATVLAVVLLLWVVLARGPGGRGERRDAGLALVAVLAGLGLRLRDGATAPRVTAPTSSGPWAPWSRVEELVAGGALLLALALLAVALVGVRPRWRGRSALERVLLVLAAAAPLALLAHLPGMPWARLVRVADPFLGLALLGVGLVVARWITGRTVDRRRGAVLVAAAVVVLAGATVVGAASLGQRLPSSTAGVPAAAAAGAPAAAAGGVPTPSGSTTSSTTATRGDGRPSAVGTTDPDDLAAARWAATHLPARSVVAGTRFAAALADVDGGERVLARIDDRAAGVLAADAQATAEVVASLQGDGLRYVVTEHGPRRSLPSAPVGAALVYDGATVSVVDVGGA